MGLSDQDVAKIASKLIEINGQVCNRHTDLHGDVSSLKTAQEFQQKQIEAIGSSHDDLKKFISEKLECLVSKITKIEKKILKDKFEEVKEVKKTKSRLKNVRIGHVISGISIATALFIEIVLNWNYLASLFFTIKP